jgi:molecular chaperone GrpE
MSPRERPDEEAVREEIAERRSRSAEGRQSADGSEAAPEVNGAAPSDAEQPVEVDELAEAKARCDEYLDLAKRTQADFENFRKRSAKDMAAAGARAKAGLLRELLPVVDNIERALASVEQSDDGVGQGLKLVYAELQGVLTRNGVEAMEPKGDQFDPTVHEAISTHPQEGAEPGTVVDVVEKGYKLDETVIRPARVVVAA